MVSVWQGISKLGICSKSAAERRPDMAPGRAPANRISAAKPAAGEEKDMAAVTNIAGLSDGNQILGTFPEMIDSNITFKGKNNILYCEPGVILKGSELLFKSDNSVLYLSSSKFPYKLCLKLGYGLVFHMGKDNYINQTMSVFLSEQRHCFIGDNCIFAPGITIRNSDPHLIYDCASKKRINPTRSIYIGDHVWTGQDVMILKGTQIDSGSIVGGRSVVAGSHIPHNTAWAGSPASQIKEGIFWNTSCVDEWNEEMTEASQNYADYVKLFPEIFQLDDGTFTYNESEEIPFDRIDQELNALKTSQEKCEYLIRLSSTKSKNRFVHRL